MPIQIDLGTSSTKPAPQKIPEGPVVGIDLGTTNSLVAYVDPKIKKAEVLAGPGENKLVPSVVELGDDGQIISIGEKAFNTKVAHPKNTIFSMKRLMGRSLKDVGTETEFIPYDLTEDELGSQVRIKIGGKTFSPVEISAHILRTLKSRAEKNLGTKVDRAVVTVPAYFDDAQRTATKAAGRLAGLDVLRVLNEPTAAALAYGWSEKNPGVVAVYDLGGGTFDISILRIEENVFEVLSTSGDTHLGGDDLDQALALYVREKLNIKEESALAGLLFEAERVKRELTKHSEVDFSWGSQKLSISRDDAESLWRPFVIRSLLRCAEAIKNSGLEKEQIKDILLVGGATRVPLVKKMVGEFFGRAPNDSLNPEEAVALGAALQAEVLAGLNKDRLLLDVLPLSLGIETMGGVVAKLILRNATIPTEARELYTNHAENQNAFDIHVLQGERELVKDCRSLARFKLRGLAAAPAGFHRIEVLFRVDANGILNARARDLRSGLTHEIEVRPSFGISEDELLKLLEESIDKAEDDMVSRQLIEARLEAENVIRATDVAIKNAGSHLRAEELSLIKARLADLKNAKQGSSPEEIKHVLFELDAVSHELAEIQVNEALKNALSGKDVAKV